MVVEIAGDAGEFESAFHHAQRRIAITIHDAITERSVIGPDANGDASGLAKRDEWGEPFANPFEFCRVLGIRILNDFELFRVRVIAGIDPDFFDPSGGFKGRLRLEMDVGNDRNRTTDRPQTSDNLLEISGVFNCGGSDADDLATDRDEFQRLGDGSRGVHRIASNHRLHADGVIAPNADSTDGNLAGHSAGGVER